ncbi:MAG TPA: cytoplasmic protein [Ignavibacteriales bacterium]|nr:cytoplasmic protein [Ignavibacteriales bacterium]
MDQDPLFGKIAALIQESKQRVAVSVNAELTMLYWNIGKHIKTEILNNKRADYGQRILITLSQQLTENFGKGWSVKQLQHCLHIAEIFPDEQNVYTLCRQLTWSHLRAIMYIEKELKREFYIEMCKMERWSVRQLSERIGSMLYERTAISKKSEETIKQDLNLLKDEQKLSPDLVFRDPYFLDFLGLKDTYSEKDLETAIIAELQRFILEFGNDFAFLARQKRITIDNEDYKIDLLFYHRKLKCLVAIDLKLDKFKAVYKGQMELYLRWLEKYEAVEGENSPVGLILCSDSNKEHIELLRLDKSKIKVATYLTELPPVKLLQEKLHRAISIAREKLENSTKDFSSTSRLED